MKDDSINGWKEVTVADVAEVRYGRTKPKTKGDIPVYGSGGVYDWVSEALVKHPTLIIGRKGTAGLVHYTEQPCWPSDTTFWLSWCDDIEVDHWFIYLTLLAKPLSGEHARTTMPSLTRDTLENHLIRVPPLPEQRAIARALGAVQAAKEARRREADLERERKQALMRHLFTHGTRGEPTRRTEIGEMPRSWPTAKLEELIAIARGQIDPRDDPYSTMPHVGPENIEQDTGRLLPTKTAAELGLVSGKHLFSSKDVLYSKIRPHLCKATLPGMAGICSADVYPLRPVDKRLTRNFLYCLLLSSGFLARAVAHQARTGIPKINRAQLLSISVPLPPVAEQVAIANTLLAVNQKCLILIREIALLDELFRAMLEELMSGRLSAEPLIERAEAQAREAG